MKASVWKRRRLAACFCVLLASCDKEPASPSGGSGKPGASTFQIKSLTAERSGDHLHLTAIIHIKNPGPAPLILTPPAAQLWIGKDNPAAPFIAPGLEPAIIAPGAESDADTHWWLAAPDLSGSLELEIAGARQAVKNAGDFPLDSLAESKPAMLPWPDWRASSR